MTDVIETGTTTEATPKLRKARTWSPEQREAASKRSKARWRKKKRGETKEAEVGIAPSKGAAPVKAVLSGEGTAMPMKARLTAYGVNPTTGAVELFSQDLAESMGDLLPNLIALLYNGSVMTEIRLEQR